VERVYAAALRYELSRNGLHVDHQMEILIPYKDIRIAGQRLDLLVERCALVELKAVAALNDVHLAQTLSYLRAARLPLGLLINFHAMTVKDGLRRVINDRWVPEPTLHPSSSLGSLSPSQLPS
jgi:GxxExxY protein